MISARVSLILGAAMFLAAAVIAEAQQPKKVLRTGYLAGGPSDSEFTRSRAIRQALRERGYIEEQNIAIEYRYAEGKRERLPELAAELVRLKVDIILVAGGNSVVRAAMNATKTTPIVMVGAGLDPVKSGLINSLARPGGQRHRHYQPSGRARREAAGAAQRSRPKTCSCRRYL